MTPCDDGSAPRATAQKGACAPDREVVVLVVDERRDAAVGVVLGVLWRLVLALLEVEVDRLVSQAELLQDEGDLPVR